MSRGRPTLFTPQTGQMVYDRLVEMGSLPKACRTPGMPKKTTIYRWRDEGDADIAAGNTTTEKAQFSALFARARGLQAEILVDEALDAAQNDALDMLEGNGINGLPKGVVREHKIKIARAKLKVDTMLAIAAKLDPKRFANTQKHADADGNVMKTPVGFVTLTQLLSGEVPEEAKPHTPANPQS